MTDREFLVIDLETIPDPRHWTPPADPTEAAKMPPVSAHQIVCIGAALLGRDMRLTKIKIIGEEKSEAEALVEFSRFVEKTRPNIVSWSGRGFDLPVIQMRSMHFGVPIPWYFRDRDYRYRFSDKGHIDLCDQLADYGASRFVSMDSVARLIGLPGKAGIDGSQVGSMHRDGKLSAIADYCLCDVIQTAGLLLRWQFIQGAIELSHYQEMASQLLAEIDTNPRLVHLADKIDRPLFLLHG